MPFLTLFVVLVRLLWLFSVLVIGVVFPSKRFVLLKFCIFIYPSLVSSSAGTATFSPELSPVSYIIGKKNSHIYIHWFSWFSGSKAFGR